MPLVRRLRRRGVNITVEAHGEVLFAATGDVGRWTNRFSQRARSFTAQEAPSNKRPRWGHYGKPLKTTFKASTTYQPGRMRVYSAVGSTANHAAYVDQGTGVYAGGSPYPAKVLPPWAWGSPSLYEATWRPPSRGTAGAGDAVWSRPAVGTVMIKGQKPQFFFDKGLARAFRSMRMRSVLVPGEGGPKISGALASVPDQIAGFIGATPADAAFRASLEEWRSWRDEHFNSGRILGRDYYSRSSSPEGMRRRAAAQAAAQRRQSRRTLNKIRRAQESAARSKRWRAAQKAKNLNKPSQSQVNAKARQADRNAFLAAMVKKYGARNIDRASIRYANGYWYILVRRLTENAGGDFKPEWREIRAKAKTG